MSALHPAGATISPAADDSSEMGGVIVLPPCVSFALPPLKPQRRMAIMTNFKVARDENVDNKVDDIELPPGASFILELSQAGCRDDEITESFPTGYLDEMPAEGV